MTNCERRAPCLAPCDGGGREAREELLCVVSRIERLHRLGRQHFEEDELVRLVLQRLWIALGEAARRYCQAEGVGAGMLPWADMIGFRGKLVHVYVSEVSSPPALGASLRIVDGAVASRRCPMSTPHGNVRYTTHL